MTTTGPRRIPWDDFLAMHLREIGLALIALVALALAWHVVELPGGTELAGTVASAGRPVTYGTVTVIASDDRVYTAPIATDGTYRFTSLPPGPVRVAVSSPNPRSVVERMSTAEAAGGVAPLSPPDALSGADRAAAGGAGKISAPRAAARGAGKSSAGDGASEPVQVSVAAPNGTAPPFPVPVSPAARQDGWFRIPGRYASPATSGIRGEVKRGRTPLHLKLD
jgi:hypothetical protein